nr:uncharacterized protein LOC108080593 [Drosophila kikkawai]
MESKRNITDLPLEILDLLFGYCGDSTNKVYLAVTHPYLVQGFVYHCRNSIEYLYFNAEISLSFWRTILPVCGSYIKGIVRCIANNIDDHAELSDLISLHCTKLEKIKLFFVMDDISWVKSLICQVQSTLRDIELKVLLNKMNSKMLHEFPELPLLERLCIFNIPVDNYYHIRKFENLVELQIGCSDIGIDIDILVLCAPLKKLRIMHLRDVRIIATEQNEVHLSVIPLEELLLSGCEILIEFPACFKLKTIDLMDNVEKNVGALEQLIFSQERSLESLSFERFLNNEIFIDIIQSFPKLRYLYLPVLNVKIDLEFVRQIVDILRGNGVTPKNPFVLKVNQYNRKYKHLLRWLKFISHPELIKRIVCSTPISRFLS